MLQPWYANDLAMMDTAGGIVTCLGVLQEAGPMFGYHPEPEKSWAICPAADQEAGRAAFDEAGLGVQWTSGHRYVGGFVGSVAMRDRWIEDKVKAWVEGVESLAKVALRYPQAAHAGLSLIHI